MSALASAAFAKTEEPSFAIVEKVGAVEIRQYAPRLAAEVLVDGAEEDARSAGFTLLANFIFGNNSTRTSIAMTAPVAQQAAKSETIAMTAPVEQTREGGGKWRVRFYMPSTYTRSTLPVPTNGAVKIVEVPSEIIAVLRFSNSRSAEAVAEKTAVLLSTLSGSKWSATGTPTAYFYDPPWTLPFWRRNEVGVPVRR
ncbi:MAG: heme-binding protein [Alphaproteobacteria bacterium]|nr:heme-binding protein [Alphaproteobacteria bacterium]